MSKAIILSVDDDEQVLSAINRDLKSKYRKEYRIISTSSAKEGLELIAELQKKSESIALFLIDQRMPEMLGVEFLEKAKEYYPDAKRVLLTAYSDTEAAIKAINMVNLDYYLMKPWNPPEEKLYPVLDDLLDDWENNVIPDVKSLKLVSMPYSSKAHELKDFLSANLIPYLWVDYSNKEEVESLCKTFTFSVDDLPLAITEDGELIKNPSITELAATLGMNPEVKNEIYDVTIIGAGPAGLAAAVYGASEGLKTLLIEKRAPGGQAGTSSRIENYLGFPKGLSGQDLARRAITQANRFGTEFLSPQEVVGLEIKDNYKIIKLKDGQEVVTKSLVITTGVNYRKLEAKGLSNFTGAGVFYGAAMTEASLCKDKAVYIVGGGNSAGQAAMYLSTYAKSIHILIRKDSLASSMSQYLIDQLEQTPNIHLIPNSEVIEAIGDQHLEEIVIKNNSDGTTVKKKAAALFIFIGAKPITEWINIELIKDDRGYLETGRELNNYQAFKKRWKIKRPPALLETSFAGIFAAGDVRAGAMNRVASAVGEGAMSIKLVHEYLEQF